MCDTDSYDECLLSSRLLEPIGSWREECAKPSRGRRWKKLQRRKNAASETVLKPNNNDSTTSVDRPEAMAHITVGFNSTMRCLEALCQTGPVPTLEKSEKVPGDGSTSTSTTSMTSDEDEDGRSEKPKSESKPLAIVFISRATLPVELMRPISLAVEHVSKTQSSEEEKLIRLVPLSKNAETRLSRAMKIPKVGIIGLKPCKPASVLVEYVREHVPGLREIG